MKGREGAPKEPEPPDKTQSQGRRGLWKGVITARRRVQVHKSFHAGGRILACISRLDFPVALL